jgi:hypothetical protein
MADMKITEYNSHNAPATGDQFFMIGTSEEYRIDYDALASAILDKLTTKTYSGISNNVIDAIAALNSNLKRTYTYTVNTEDEFVSSLLNDLRTLSAGNYVVTAVRQNFYVCTVCASVQGSNRCVSLIIPQAGNIKYIISATYNNGTIDTKKFYDNTIIDALNSSINFGVNTSAASTEKAVYIKAVADAVAETVGITTNKSILGYVFVSGIDAFSCMGAIRGSTIRMIIVASNAATYSVVRNSDGAVTYKEIAWVS